MRSKDKTLMAAIEKFVSDYTDSNGISPTMQEVADGVGSSKATVQRYIAQLCEDGILDYSGYRTMTSTKTKAAAIRVPRSRHHCLRHSEICRGKHRGIRPPSCRTIRQRQFLHSPRLRRFDDRSRY